MTTANALGIAFEPHNEHLDDDEAPTTYYAIVESGDTDLHYLSPGAYDEPLETALAADRMAELIAELQRECDAIRNRAAHAREQLAEGKPSAPRSFRDPAPTAGLPDRSCRSRTCTGRAAWASTASTAAAPGAGGHALAEAARFANGWLITQFPEKIRTMPRASVSTTILPLPQ